MLWGIYHGAFQIAERLLLRGKAVSSQVLRLGYFFPVVLVGWVMFRANDITAFAAHVRAMVSPLADGAWTVPGTVTLALSPQATTAMLFACLLILMQGQFRPAGVVVAGVSGEIGRYARLAFVAAAVTVCTIYVIPQAFSPFLYFRF